MYHQGYCIWMKKHIRILVCLLLAALGVEAQQDPQFTMYMFNKQIHNPGYVGAAGLTEIVFGSRTQWVGIEGHPTTFSLAANTPVPILFGAVGLHVMNDQIGPFSATQIRGTYAFKLPLGTGGTALQIGLSPGFYFRNLDATNFTAPQGSDIDPVLRDLVGRVVGSNNFDLGAGLYFYKAAENPSDNGEKFYIGVSADHLLQPTIDDFSENFEITRAFNLMGGYRFDLGGKTPISLVPSVLFKFAGPNYQLDANLNLHIRPMVFGLSYRGLANADSFCGILGFHASQRLFVAYSYDYVLSGLTTATSGSHELVISYMIPAVKRFQPPELDVKNKPDIR